ncbi:sulfur carrier protein ThiS [Flavicella sp.]|uniref:sulfur carrier protein ThiS n=1 Tax=Flavicella sp. TaxID=2957742 RepID=UPI00301969B4
MNIRVNNIQKKISQNTSVEDLLELLNHTQNGIAVAINEEIVLKDNWSFSNLKENDEVLIIQATQGG